MLREARGVGVSGALIPSYGPERWERQSQLLREQGNFALWGGFGLHPWAIAATRDSWRDQLEEGWRRHAVTWGHKLRAIGEFGLDRSNRMADVETPLQSEIFDWHLQRARRESLPIILHLVRSDGLAGELLASGGPWAGVVHGFSSHKESVAGFLRLGLCLSYGPGILRHHKVREALRATPLDRMMFETDAPGSGVSGPADLIEIVQAASQVLAKSVEYLLARHRENCARVFGLPSGPPDGVN